MCKVGHCRLYCEHMPLDGVERDQFGNLTDGDDQTARLTLNRAAKSIPIVPKHVLLHDAPDIEWDVLTCLPAGGISPVHTW
jgi:hypothetical protein